MGKRVGTEVEASEETVGAKAERTGSGVAQGEGSGSEVSVREYESERSLF